MSKAEKNHPASKYGTDKEYLEWVSYQPSCLDGSWNQWDENGGRCIACHVRRIDRGAGMGKKPPYSAVPLTDRQHKIQSIDGELAALVRFTYLSNYTEAMAREWFENEADIYLEQWIEVMKQKKGIL